MYDKCGELTGNLQVSTFMWTCSTHGTRKCGWVDLIESHI